MKVTLLGHFTETDEYANNLYLKVTHCQRDVYHIVVRTYSIYFHCEKSLWKRSVLISRVDENESDLEFKILNSSPGFVIEPRCTVYVPTEYLRQSELKNSDPSINNLRFIIRVRF